MQVAQAIESVPLRLALAGAVAFSSALCKFPQTINSVILIALLRNAKPASLLSG